LKNRRNILFVTTGYPRFRGDRFGCFIKELTLELSKTYNVTVLAPHAPGYSIIDKEPGLTVYRLPYFFLCGSVAYGGGIPTNIKKWSVKLQLPFFMISMTFWCTLLSFKKDLVHAQWGISALYAWLKCKVFNTPLAVTFHGSDLHSSSFLRTVSKWSNSHSDASICVSEEQFGYLGNNKASIIPMPVDTVRFHNLKDPNQRLELKNELSIENDHTLFLYVGYFIPLKNVDFLIECFAKTDTNSKLYLAGDGPEQEALQQLCTELNILDRVIFIGSVDYYDIHKWFQVADIHLLASDREGKPNVISQAMACSIPSISTSVGGVPELIEDAKTGFLLEKKHQSYVDKMNLLCNNSTLRKEMGEAALVKFNSLDLDLKSIAEKHVTVYNKLFK